MPEAIIVGAGPGGLYAAWRLLNSKKFESVTIYEMSSERIGGRIFTKTFSDGGYVDTGGMRYSTSQKVINKVIEELGITNTTDFVETHDRLFYLRGQHIRESQISKTHRVPYENDTYNSKVVDDVFGALSKAIAGTRQRTRQQWCDFLEAGVIPRNYGSSVYPDGANLGNIGYWDLMIDYFGSEAFKYCADAGGYTSNIINWNAAAAIPYNSEFAITEKYMRFRGGYTTFIEALANGVEELGGIIKTGYRLVDFTTGNNDTINCIFLDSKSQTVEVSGNAVFLAMPKRSVELVRSTAKSNSLAAQLGTSRARLKLEAVIEQPSYKIAISFKESWWKSADFSPDLASDAWGPTITDLPLRQIYYFTPEKTAPNTYAMLASYDDMRFTRFWQEFETPLTERRKTPESLDFQPLSTGTPLDTSMMRMVAEQLAEVHFNPRNAPNAATLIYSQMKEGYFMDWSLDPFGAGYHAWAAHTSVCDVMTKVRKPLSDVNDNLQLYLVGSAYSNDQAWVEGAFCTAESVLVDFLGLPPLIDTTDYPLICKC